MENKLAVIFPGIGYHTDKPLLYYGKKLAKKYGYEILEISYGGFSKDIKGDREKMQETFKSALAQTEAVLEKTEFTAYEKILFLSKSVGTAVASAYAGRHGIEAAHIYFTPVLESFPFMEKKGIVFHGTADPWAETEAVDQGCEGLGLPIYKTEGANHSMETGDVKKDLEILQEIMENCETFLQRLA